MKKYLLFFCTFFSLILFSQTKPKLSEYKTLNEKLEKWLTYCENLAMEEKYSQLVTEAEIGINLSKNNPKYLAKFYHYKGYGYEYTDNQYAKAAEYFEKSQKLAHQVKDTPQETLALMRLNYQYYSLKEEKKAKALIVYIKKIVDTIKDPSSKATLLGSLGEYYLDRSEYENFINYKLKAIDLLKENKKMNEMDQNNIGVSYLQIADAYNDMEHYDKAIEYCNYAKPYLNKSDGIAFYYNTLIEAYTLTNDLDSAKKSYAELISMAKNNPILYLNISYANRNMAEIYLNQNNLSVADNYADKALVFGEKSNDEEILMEANVIKGKVLFHQKKYSQAIAQLQKAESIANLYDKNFFAEINYLISESYAKLNLWEKAYQYGKIYTIMKDSLAVEASKKTLADAEAKYQNKNKQQEIKTLSTENNLHILNIETAKKQRIFLISGLVSIAIIGGLFYNQSRNRKKNNQKLSLLNSELDKANKNKMRFFGILNHDLRSPVSSLVHFLHLQKDAPELMDQETKNRLNNQIVDSADQLLQQMEDLLLWSKSQMEKFEPEKKYFSIKELFSELYAEMVWIDKSTLLFENPEELTLISDKEYIKTILRNLIANAAKVLQNNPQGKIVCNAKSIGNHITISVKDNGGGTDLEKFRALYNEEESIGIKNGLGLHVIRDLCKAVDAEIQVISDRNIGQTTITLTLHNAA